MDKYILERVNKEADILLDTKITIRELAGQINLSKSTVHKDLNERLKDINEDKYNKIKEIFQEHIEIRHIRGGEATKRKYLSLH